MSKSPFLPLGFSDFSEFKKGRFGKLAKDPGSIPRQDLWDFKHFIRKRSHDFHERYYEGIKLYEVEYIIYRVLIILKKIIQCATK